MGQGIVSANAMVQTLELDLLIGSLTISRKMDKHQADLASNRQFPYQSQLRVWMKATMLTTFTVDRCPLPTAEQFVDAVWRMTMPLPQLWIVIYEQGFRQSG